MMREYRAQDPAFEIVDMNLEERSKYRRPLASQLSPNAFESASAAVRADVAAAK
jgi:hypothetical protein